EARRAKLAPGHPDTLFSMQDLATFYLERGRYDEGEALLKEVLAAQRTKLSAEHPDTLLTLNNLAEFYRDRGRYREAEPLYQEAVAGARRTHGLSHPTTQQIIRSLALLHSNQRTPQLAEALLRELAACLREKSGPESVPYANQLWWLAMNLLDQRKFAEAEPVARDCLAVRAKDRPDAWPTYHTRSLLGGALLGQGK